MDKQRVLVADPLSAAGVDLLRRHDLTVDVRTKQNPSDLLAMIPQYDALIVRSGTQVTADLLAAATRLKIVVRAGVGVDNIDIPAATELGILVANAPLGNVVAAAEHTIGLLFALARHIPQAYMAMQSGLWDRKRFMGVEVRNKVLGSLGLGRVASEVARRAHGLGMKVVAYDPYVPPEYAERLNVELVALDEVFRRADFLTLHMPLTLETRNLVNAQRLALLKPTAYLINCARGGIVDAAALVDALRERRLAGAALDVYEHEPLPADSPLRGLPNLVLTPHLGGSTTEAQDQVAVDAAQQVLTALAGTPPRYVLNAPLLPATGSDLLLSYVDVAERLGRFLRAFAGTHLERLEVMVCGELADYDLTYLRAGALKGLLAGIVGQRVTLFNALHIAEQRGLRVSEQKEANCPEYSSLLRCRVTAGDRQWQVAGVSWQGRPTIVEVDDFWVTFPAEGRFVLVRHHDRPGTIGRVGSLLGAADVNVSFMHVGRKARRGEAVMVLGVDEEVPNALQAQILALPNTYWVKFLAM